MSRLKILSVPLAIVILAAVLWFLAPRRTDEVHVGPRPPISAPEGAELVALADSLGSAGLLVIQRGEELLAWGDVDVPRDVRSIRKSVTSLVLGRLVLAGRLNPDSNLDELGIDDADFALNAQERQATVRQLMESRSGVYHAAAYETRSAARNRPERGSHLAGEFWYYNNWDFNVLETIASAAAGHDDYCETFAEYAGPLLEITDPTSQCRIQLEREVSLHAAHPLRLSARTLGALAQIYLNDGIVDGRRILPEGWTAWSAQPVPGSKYQESDRFNYARLFWSLEPDDLLSEYSSMSRGSGAQYVWIVPEIDAAVVHVVRTWPLYLRFRLDLIPQDDAAQHLGSRVLAAIIGGQTASMDLRFPHGTVESR